MAEKRSKNDEVKSHPLRNIGNKDAESLFSIQIPYSDKTRTRKKHRFMALHYRKAKVYKGTTGSVGEAWHVYYYYLDPTTGRMVRFKVYEDINRIKDLSEKELYASELIKNINKALVDGFDPFETEMAADAYIKSETKKAEEKNSAKSPRLVDAFAQFLKNKQSKNLARQSIQAYQSFISGYESWLITNQLADINVSEVNTALIKQMLEDLQDDLKWGDSTYNNYLRFWVTLINWFSKKPRFWVNRDSFDIGEDSELEEKVTRPMKHQYFGDTIFDKVKNAMESEPDLMFYSKFIYYSCMRPDEIRFLKIENVDITGRYIKIVGKTKSRSIPICDELADMFNSLKLHEYPAYFYVIGKDGKVNDQTHSEGHYARRFREIRKNLGLSADFTLYGMKHTRVVSLLNAGYSDAEIMNLTGHKDTASYDKYKRDLIGHMKTRLKGKTLTW